MSSRDAILGRVRAATSRGPKPPLPDRGAVGYQGAGDAEPLARFREMATAMGMFVRDVAGPVETWQAIDAILAERSAKAVLVGAGPALDDLGLDAKLRETGRDVTLLGRGDVPRERLFAADASISGVDRVVAETGSLVVAASPTRTRLESLIAPLHLAVVSPKQLSLDLFDVFEAHSSNAPPPSNLVFITGPSKTGDIELKLVTGVHGPGEVHVLVRRDQA